MVSVGLTPKIKPRELSSFVRKYFKIKERQVKDNKTGLESLVKFDSCQLENCDSSAYAEICGKMYIHSIKDGTTNLIRHVLTKH
jgi:hypothetical protein